MPKKKPLIFLHGYLADKNSFYLQYPYFSKNYQIYALDLAGFGQNTSMPKAYSLDDYCQSVLEFIKKNDINKPSVIAHSFGGRIAIKLASQNADLFDKIVLTGSAGLKPRFSIRKWLKKISFKFLSFFVKKSKLNKFYSSDYQKLSPIMKQSFIKIVNEHLDDRLDRIQNKTLVVCGENDRETPLYMAKKLNKKIKNSRLFIIKKAGHFAFIDSPYTFNMEVMEFLNSK